MLSCILVDLDVCEYLNDAIFFFIEGLITETAFTVLVLGFFGVL